MNIVNWSEQGRTYRVEIGALVNALPVKIGLREKLSSASLSLRVTPTMSAKVARMSV